MYAMNGHEGRHASASSDSAREEGGGVSRAPARTQPRRALVSILQRNVAKLREVLREKDDLIARLACSEGSAGGRAAGDALELESALAVAHTESSRLRRDLLEAQRRVDELASAQSSLRARCKDALTSAEAMVAEVMSSTARAQACDAQAERDVRLLQDIVAPAPVLGDVVLVAPADPSQVADAVNAVTGKVDPIALALCSRVALIVNEAPAGWSVHYFANGAREHRLPASRLQVLYRHVGNDADAQLDVIAEAAARVSGAAVASRVDGPNTGSDSARSLRTAASKAALKRVLSGTAAVLRIGSASTLVQQAGPGETHEAGEVEMRVLAQKAASFRIGVAAPSTRPLSARASHSLRTWDASRVDAPLATNSAWSSSVSAAAPPPRASLSSMDSDSALSDVGNHDRAGANRARGTDGTSLTQLATRPVVQVRPIGGAHANKYAGRPGVVTGGLPRLEAPRRAPSPDSTHGLAASSDRERIATASHQRARSAGRSRTPLEPLLEDAVSTGTGHTPRAGADTATLPSMRSMHSMHKVVDAGGAGGGARQASTLTSAVTARGGGNVGPYVPTALAALLRAYQTARSDNVALRMRNAQLEAENFALREGVVLEAHKHARSGALDSDRMRSAVTQTLGGHRLPSPSGSASSFGGSAACASGPRTTPHVPTLAGSFARSLPRVPSSMKAVMTGRTRVDDYPEDVLVEDDDSGSGWEDDDAHATKVA